MECGCVCGIDKRAVTCLPENGALSGALSPQVYGLHLYDVTEHVPVAVESYGQQGLVDFVRTCDSLVLPYSTSLFTELIPLHHSWGVYIYASRFILTPPQSDADDAGSDP